MSNSVVVSARTLLFEQAEGSAEVSIGEGKLRSVLPILYSVPEMYEFEFTLHPKDRRVLIVFDGDFLPGSLSRNSQIIHTQDLGAVYVNESNVYKRKSGEVGPLNYLVNNGIACQSMSRHFILADSCRFMGRRYKDNLAPRYVMIQVEGGKVSFLSSKY